MAHEISEVTINGQRIVEAMYANRPAWHGLGEIFDENGREAPDSETAIKLAHLDWTVEKEELQLAKDQQAIADYYALVRQDTRDSLYVVGNEYEVLQNRDAFGFLDSLFQDGVMRYESAFALKGGRGICLLARMPSVDYVTPHDPLLRYIMLHHWHGGKAVHAVVTSVRVVCANTIRLAMETSSAANKLTIRHSGDLNAKMRTMKGFLTQFDRAFTGYCEDAQKLLKGYTPEQSRDYVGELFPMAVGASRRQRIARERQVQQVRNAFRSPAQQIASVKGTWWALFNSVTEAVDHGKPMRQAKDPVARRENRFMNVIEGQAADFKRKALDLALQMSS